MKRVSVVSVASEVSVASSSGMPEGEASDLQDGECYDLKGHKDLIQRKKKKKLCKKPAASRKQTDIGNVASVCKGRSSGGSRVGSRTSRARNH